MSKQRKNIFEWNHISDKLNQAQIQELKEYYRVYHKKCWCYKQATKSFRRLKLIGNSLAILFASGGHSIVHFNRWYQPDCNQHGSFIDTRLASASKSRFENSKLYICIPILYTYT